MENMEESNLMFPKLNDTLQEIKYDNRVLNNEGYGLQQKAKTDFNVINRRYPYAKYIGGVLIVIVVIIIVHYLIRLMRRRREDEEDLNPKKNCKTSDDCKNNAKNKICSKLIKKCVQAEQDEETEKDGDIVISSVIVEDTSKLSKSERDLIDEYNNFVKSYK